MASQNAVLWPVGTSGFGGAHTLAGVTLPALRRFVLSIPASIASPAEIMLTARYFYVLDRSDRLWRTRTPADRGQ
jgi:hypothetical protein